MIITLLPQRREDTLTLSKQGDTLNINGVGYDFSLLPEGGTLPAEAVGCEYVIGPVERVDGEIQISLIFPHGAEASENVRFPQPIVVNTDGNVELPQ